LDPLDVDGGAAGFGDVLFGEVDAGDAAALALLVRWSGGPFAAGDVEDAGARGDGDGSFEELGRRWR